jgi:hypothetical protein
MDEKLREAIGRVLYESSVPLMDDGEPTWDELSDEAKEEWMLRAEKVVEAYKKYIDDNIGGYLKIAGIDEREDV